MANEIQTKRVQVEVKVPLDEALRERRGVKLAEKERELRELEQRIKDETSGWRADKKKLKEEIKVLSQEIETKTMKVTMDATERPQFDTNEILTVLDSGEIVSTRAMTAEERQLTIDLDAQDEGDEPKEGGKVVKLKRTTKKKGDEKPN